MLKHLELGGVLGNFVIKDLVVATEHDIVNFDIEVDVAETVKLFDALNHLDAHFEHIHLS